MAWTDYLLSGLKTLAGGGQNFDFGKVILPGLAGVTGALDNRDRTYSSTSSSTPNYDPAALPLRDALIDGYMRSLGENTDLSGYTAQGIKTINRNSDLQRQSLEGIMAARGIAGPASGSPIANLEANRFAEINDFETGIPLLERSMRDESLRNASGFFSSLPHGTTTTQSGKTGGNKLGGFVGGIAEVLAQQYGSGGLGGSAAAPIGAGSGFDLDGIINGIKNLFSGGPSTQQQITGLAGMNLPAPTSFGNTGRSPEEIAAMTGLSLDTIKNLQGMISTNPVSTQQQINELASMDFQPLDTYQEPQTYWWDDFQMPTMQSSYLPPKPTLQNSLADVLAILGRA